MKKKLIALVIDDEPMYGEIIEEALLEYNKASVLFEYIPIVFTSRTYFPDAQKFILDSISIGNPIDLIFCDYHLKPGHNGFEIFRLFDNSNQRPFKILHSNTSKRFSEKSEEYIQGLFDDFSVSKDKQNVIEHLKAYEENVGFNKLSGNPNFAKLYYKNYPDISRITTQYYEKYSLFDLVYIVADDDLKKIFVRKYDEECNTIKIVLDEQTTSLKYRISTIADDISGKPVAYLQINQSLIVNLLWVSKINEATKTISFITPDAVKMELQVRNFSTSLIPKDFDFPSVSEGLHRYFL